MEFPKIQFTQLPQLYGRKQKDKIDYLRKQPTIKPNYGKPSGKSYLPKTNITRVLLYDNSMQEQLLDVKLNFFKRQQCRVWRMIEKNKYAFEDRQNHRRQWHERMEIKYQDMKDEFVSRFGTKHIPVPKPEAEVDPFLINARIAPPINVLCFYLEAEKEAKAKKKSKKMKKDNKPIEKTKMEADGVNTKLLNKKEVEGYFYDSKRLLGELAQTNCLYAHSIEDPRFRSLQESLIPPETDNDGYLQLNPGYYKGPKRRKRRPDGKARVIELPRFYARPHLVSRESVKSRRSVNQMEATC